MATRPTGQDVPRSLKNIIKQRYDREKDARQSRKRFSWVDVDGIQVPYIYRDDVKYVLVSMVNEYLLSRYPRCYPKEVTDMPPLQSVPITVDEANMLNQMQLSLFKQLCGPFVSGDLIVELDEALKFYVAVRNFFASRPLSKTRNKRNGSDTSEAQTPCDSIGNDPDIQDVAGYRTGNMNVIPDGWILVNNTVVPCIRRVLPFNPTKLIPLPVIEQAIGALSNAAETRASPVECFVLNMMCQRVGHHFKFPGDLKLVQLSDVVCADTVATVCRLPELTPFVSAHDIINKRIRNARQDTVSKLVESGSDDFDENRTDIDGQDIFSKQMESNVKRTMDNSSGSTDQTINNTRPENPGKSSSEQDILSKLTDGGETCVCPDISKQQGNTGETRTDHDLSVTQMASSVVSPIKDGMNIPDFDALLYDGSSDNDSLDDESTTVHRLNDLCNDNSAGGNDNSAGGNDNSAGGNDNLTGGDVSNDELSTGFRFNVIVSKDSYAADDLSNDSRCTSHRTHVSEDINRDVLDLSSCSSEKDLRCVMDDGVTNHLTAASSTHSETDEIPSPPVDRSTSLKSNLPYTAATHTIDNMSFPQTYPLGDSTGCDYTNCEVVLDLSAANRGRDERYDGGVHTDTDRHSLGQITGSSTAKRPKPLFDKRRFSNSGKDSVYSGTEQYDALNSSRSCVDIDNTAPGYIDSTTICCNNNNNQVVLDFTISSIEANSRTSSRQQSSNCNEDISLKPIHNTVPIEPRQHTVVEYTGKDVMGYNHTATDEAAKDVMGYNHTATDEAAKDVMGYNHTATDEAAKEVARNSPTATEDGNSPTATEDGNSPTATEDGNSPTVTDIVHGNSPIGVIRNIYDAKYSNASTGLVSQNLISETVLDLSVSTHTACASTNDPHTSIRNISDEVSQHSKVNGSTQSSDVVPSVGVFTDNGSTQSFDVVPSVGVFTYNGSTQSSDVVPSVGVFTDNGSTQSSDVVPSVGVFTDNGSTQSSDVVQTAGMMFNISVNGSFMTPLYHPQFPQQLVNQDPRHSMNVFGPRLEGIQPPLVIPRIHTVTGLHRDGFSSFVNQREYYKGYISNSNYKDRTCTSMQRLDDSPTLLGMPPVFKIPTQAMIPSLVKSRCHAEPQDIRPHSAHYKRWVKRKHRRNKNKTQVSDPGVFQLTDASIGPVRQHNNHNLPRLEPINTPVLQDMPMKQTINQKLKHRVLTRRHSMSQSTHDATNLATNPATMSGSQSKRRALSQIPDKDATDHDRVLPTKTTMFQSLSDDSGMLIEGMPAHPCQPPYLDPHGKTSSRQRRRRLVKKVAKSSSTTKATYIPSMGEIVDDINQPTRLYKRKCPFIGANSLPKFKLLSAKPPWKKGKDADETNVKQLPETRSDKPGSKESKTLEPGATVMSESKHDSDDMSRNKKQHYAQNLAVSTPKNVAHSAPRNLADSAPENLANSARDLSCHAADVVGSEREGSDTSDDLTGVRHDFVLQGSDHVNIMSTRRDVVDTGAVDRVQELLSASNSSMSIGLVQPRGEMVV